MGAVRVQHFRSGRSIYTVDLANGSISSVETRGSADDRTCAGFCETQHSGGLLLAYFSVDRQSPSEPRVFFLQQGQLRIALDQDVQVVHRRTLGLSRLRVIEHDEEHRWSKYIGHLALLRRGTSWPIQEWDSYDFLSWVARVANDARLREDVPERFI